ncbi:MAG: S9 family peptidase [Sphingobacteriales bacterium]|nr:MAG: S9 family peptidase [Sphingobacteriales bacterium]
MRIPLLTLSLLTTTMALAQNPAFKGTYPETDFKTDKTTDTYFGTTVKDPLRWLEDDRSAKTMDWVKRQNAATQAYLNQIPFRNAWRDRLTQLINFERYSAPFKEGEWTYFYKNDGLQAQSVLYRQKGSGTPEIFLDPNTFSKDGTTSLSGVTFSKDGSRCAYMISEGGSDWGKAFVLDAKTKKRIGTPLENLKFSSLSWKGNDGFYYSTYDKPQGSQLTAKTDQHKLYWHTISELQSKDALIYGDDDQQKRRYVGGGVTEDENFLVISAANATYGNELYLRNLSMSRAPLVTIATGFDHEQEVIHSEKGMLYLLTNRNAPNRKLVKVDASNPVPENWQTVIPEGKAPLSVTTVGGKFFAQYLNAAISEVYRYDLSGKNEGRIELPGTGTASGFSGKWGDTETYYVFTNYIQPATIYRYDIASGKSTLYKKSNVKFDPAGYESTQVFYTSKDGTKVPMIITSKKGIARNSENPTMLYGYGGFNVSLSPSFSTSIVSFLEQGGVYAVANLRGGGEYGDAWHNAGTKLNKQNVFDDFIAAAEYLISEKVTKKEKLAISGGSNGGLLVGAAMTQRPDLFGVAFPAVGVLDMLRYHTFTAGAGWAYDYGTSNDSKEMFQYLYQYSPVHNVRKGTCYPATMVFTGDHDDRVVPAHSFKFAAELQQAQSCSKPTLIRIETNAGHGAGKSTAQQVAEQADKWAFMWWNMGLKYQQK